MDWGVQLYKMNLSSGLKLFLAGYPGASQGPWSSKGFPAAQLLCIPAGPRIKFTAAVNASDSAASPTPPDIIPRGLGEDAFLLAAADQVFPEWAGILWLWVQWPCLPLLTMSVFITPFSGSPLLSPCHNCVSVFLSCILILHHTCSLSKVNLKISWDTSPLTCTQKFRIPLKYALLKRNSTHLH